MGTSSFVPFLSAASELFWAYDHDANAVIDRDEWCELMQQIAKRAGRKPFSQAEADAAFARAEHEAIRVAVRARGVTRDERNVLVVSKYHECGW